MLINTQTKIIEWLLNGVTYKEIQERLSWLGIAVTIEELKEIEERQKDL